MLIIQICIHKEDYMLFLIAEKPLVTMMTLRPPVYFEGLLLVATSTLEQRLHHGADRHIVL